MADIRSFIAIELPKNIQAGLGDIITSMKTQKDDPVRWVAVNNIHLTLRFLGENSPQKIEKIYEILAKIAATYSPFEMSVGGLGAFPSTNRPRVIWVGLRVPPVLLEMQMKIEAGVNSLGLAGEDRPFSPHLTLGRIRKETPNHEIVMIGQKIFTQKISDLGSFNANEVTLFRSELTSKGSIYTVMNKFLFNGGIS